MSIIQDFSLARYEDGVLTISLVPSAPIGGMSLRFLAQHRFGGISGTITKSTASGFGAGQSGITIINSGNGVFNVAINSVDSSGSDYGNYAFAAERLDSGSRTVIAEGYWSIEPSVMP